MEVRSADSVHLAVGTYPSRKPDDEVDDLEWLHVQMIPIAADASRIERTSCACEAGACRRCCAADRMCMRPSKVGSGGRSHLRARVQVVAGAALNHESLATLRPMRMGSRRRRRSGHSMRMARAAMLMVDAGVMVNRHLSR